VRSLPLATVNSFANGPAFVDPASTPVPVHPVPTPVPTTSHVFPTVLSASKAAGIAAIRISQVNGDILLEELNAKQETIIGLRLHALVNSAKKITAVAVTQMGSGPNPSPLTPAQRSAFGEITNELKQFNASNTVAPSAPGQRQGIQEKSFSGWVKSVFIAVDVGVSCGLAALEIGLNPVVDAACVAAATLADMDIRASNDPSSTGTGSGSHSDGSDGDDTSGGDSGVSGDGGDGGGPLDPSTGITHEQR
jgi:hypothetical protein